MFVAKEDFTGPVLVDGMDEAVHRQYGSLPNMVYVIDKAGKIAYKTTWTVAEEIDSVLAELTASISSWTGYGSSWMGR